MKYEVLILDTPHPGTLNLREQGCEDSWWFFEAKNRRAIKIFCETQGQRPNLQKNDVKTAYIAKKKSE